MNRNTSNICALYDNVKNINNVYAYIEMYRNSKKFVGMRL